MSFTMEAISPPFRISKPEPMSLGEFWSFALENPDLRMEREPNGDVTFMSPANGAATMYSSRAHGELYIWARQDGTGNIIDSNGGCQLPDGSVRCPDAGWISVSRWTPPPITHDAPIPCPDFVIEVRSGSDRLKPTRDKMQAWMDNGVQLGWLIDPIRKAVEIYRPHQEPEVRENPSIVEGEGPVAGFVLELGRIWG
jgi:Uma2 family endonuclease